MNVPPVCTECRPTPLEQAAAARTSVRAPSAETPREAGRAADPFALSATASAAKDLAAAPPVDSAKVAALRDRIAAGTYTIDPERIAAKMIELDLPRA